MDISTDPSRHDEQTAAAEEDWIEGIRNGEKAAFRQLFERWYNPLLRFAFRYVQSEAVAEGLVQDLFLWIWEHREEWNVEGRLNTYLFRAIKYKAMDHWRQLRTRERYLDQLILIRDAEMVPDPLAGMEEWLESTEESEFVRAAQQAIEELPERARMIYKLNRLEGLTYREIAEVLDLSPKTVEAHMGRALDYLRKRLSRYLPVLLILELGGLVL